MQFYLSEGAEDDLARICDFNVQRSEAWADRVRQRLLSRCGALRQTPEIGRRLAEPGVRRLSVTDIQYVIDYRRMGTRIEILRFQHTREIR